MLELESQPNDDPTFLARAGNLIAGAAVANSFSELVIVHIDHWFGARWLGFCGKFLGAAGVRSRSLTGELTPPPFHPHRIQSIRKYCLTDSQTFVHWGDDNWLHGFRPSQANINRTFLRNRLYAWYSGDTVEFDKGVVMVYLVHKNWNAAWYVGFDKNPEWRVAKSVAIAPTQVHELMRVAFPENIAALYQPNSI